MFKQEIEKMGLESCYEGFEDFKGRVLEKNKVMNLTAITEDEEFNIKHFLDSLSLLKLEEIQGAKRILDLGTGAGFPGVPLKIAKKDLDITLLDSLKKRIDFLNESIEDMGLEGIRGIHARAEELSRKDDYREAFDLVTSRAVANLATLYEYCLPFVKVGGYMVAMKGPDIEGELKEGQAALKALGGELVEVKKVDLPQDIEHTLVLVKKVKATPKKYPRAGGKPRKNPIGL
ncbi:16S rRNA (guanine(527)-N(7))-methyltransferase RsmG [Urinicoccus timonensis]|uniref:16S rRNA (guanine(527)-N(7))-methyltransferase RsmG n=1 Tax=Urinicoccus timonensis TaxID=2024205 RepID=UPI000C0826DB|nr:16S rRNA (guanine(527)-N(7))-methyltransferase RsmG [Urinicoccus timonensis]